MSCTFETTFKELQPRTKLLRHFNTIFNFAPWYHRVQKKQIAPPSPPLVQCCFGLAAQACISCVAANNIAIGEGGSGLLICDSKHFCQGECKKIGILAMCLNRFCPRLSGGVFRYSLTVMSITARHACMKRIVTEYYSFVWNDPKKCLA